MSKEIEAFEIAMDIWESVEENRQNAGTPGELLDEHFGEACKLIDIFARQQQIEALEYVAGKLCVYCSNSTPYCNEPNSPNGVDTWFHWHKDVESRVGNGGIRDCLAPPELSAALDRLREGGEIEDE